MGKVVEKYKLDYKPIADKAAVVQGATYRFTVLTDFMIRMECLVIFYSVTFSYRYYSDSTAVG